MSGLRIISFLEISIYYKNLDFQNKKSLWNDDILQLQKQTKALSGGKS